ncbi:MAG: transcription elongation factor GreA [Anaerolineales bacterium]|jgi:transcription elongation factor GreA
MDKTVFLTKAGFDKFQSELNYLRSNKRPEIANRLRDAMRFDEDQIDIEYQMTKDEQSLVEGRIQELERLLAQARILESQKSNGKVILGSTVTVKEEGRAPEEFTIVSSAEANSILKLISDESPLGASLLGRCVGDEIQVSAPKGSLKFKVLGIK